MSLFWQALFGALMAAVLCVMLGSQGKDISLLLGVAVCAMILVCAVSYLEPMVELIESLRELCGLEPEFMSIILKVVGVGLVAELAALICADAGNAALGRAVELLAASAVLWLCIPLITALMELIQQMTGEL